MYLRVLNTAGEYAGEINLDNVDRIKLTESGTTEPNTVQVWKGTATQTYKVSKTTYAGLTRYINRYGIN